MADFPDLTIEYVKKRGRRITKTRRFTVTLFAYLEANSLWELGFCERAIRPVFLAYGGSEQAVRAFSANLRGGLRAEAEGDYFQVPKSAPHRFVEHRSGDVAITVAYIPELFDLEPVLEPTDIRFIFMPPAWWLDRQSEALRPLFGEEARDASRAALFAAFLDRRTPLPIVQDLRFHLELYRSALEEGLLGELEGHGARASGLDLPHLVRSSHSEFEAFLAKATTRYFESEVRPIEFPRLLPLGDAPFQLTLDFAA